VRDAKELEGQRMKPGTWAAILLVPAALSPARAATLFVPRDYPTIQAAVDDANDGDTVLVAPGTYTGDGNHDIWVMEKAITIKSERGPRTCIIDCRDSGPRGHTGFWFLTGNPPIPGMPVIDGFTITGAHGHLGGGIYCYGVSPRITNCIIVGNISELGGGGIFCDGCSEVTIANCIISGNMTPSPESAARGSPTLGEAVYVGNSLHAALTNCLITGNRFAGGGAGVVCSSATITNCTISGNYASPGYGDGISAGGGDEDVLVVRNSIVYGNGGLDITIGTLPGSLPHMSCRTEYGLVGVAPSCKPKGVPGPPLDQLFARVDYWDPNGTPDDPNDDFWVQGDYHLKSQAGRWDPVSETWVKDDITSPAIDAGDPDSPIGAEPFPNGGRINLGAYGGTAEASKSYFGEPPCETIIAGDINGDCRVDFQDFVLLASHWLQGTPHAAVPPYTPPAGRPPRALQPASR
jgi:hypothetical protein